MNATRGETERLLQERVFRQMFVSHYARVVRYVEGQLSDRATAEDIAAEVFDIAWRKLDPGEPFGLPWLIRTAMHKTRDHQRRAYRGAAAVETLARFAETADEPLGSLDRIALYEAMKSLSEKDLQIVRLTYWDGLTASEVAQVLRMREGAVWTRLHRARAQLRISLGDAAGSGGVS